MGILVNGFVVTQSLEDSGEKQMSFDTMPLKPFETMYELISILESYPTESPAFRWRVGKIDHMKTFGEFVRDVKTLARYIHVNYDQDSKIALLGANSYEIVVSICAITYATRIAVSIDPRLDEAEVGRLLEIAPVDAIFYDPDAKASPEDLSKYVDDPERVHPFVAAEGSSRKSVQALLTEEVLEHTGDMPIPQPDTPYGIYFTSGTSARPKACLLNHQNIATAVLNGSDVTLIPLNSNILSFLPFNHVLQQIAGTLSVLHFCSCVCINSDLRHLVRDFQLYKPHYIAAVPLVVENFYRRIQVELKKNKFKHFMFKRLLTVSELLRKVNIDIRKKAFSAIHQNFGGNFYGMVVGSAACNPEQLKFFDQVGLSIQEGYGMTECPVITVNTDTYRRIGSVGNVYDVINIDIKLVDEEIWIKGPGVMPGYYKDEENNREYFSDGWFKTGDLGHIDDDGYLFIKGRKKNVIILSNGENVSPEELEAVYSNIAGIDEIIVFGEDKIIVAEIYTEGITEEEKGEVEERIREVNTTLPTYRRARRVIWRDEPFKRNNNQKIIREAYD